MNDEKRRVTIQVSLRLNKEQEKRFNKLKQAGGHRGKVDVIYKALNDSYYQAFGELFFV